MTIRNKFEQVKNNKVKTCKVIYTKISNFNHVVYKYNK